jgi:hypothetical protein
VLTQTIPLPAGGAGWLALVLGADVVLDLAGFVVVPEFALEGVDGAADVLVVG